MDCLGPGNDNGQNLLAPDQIGAGPQRECVSETNAMSLSCEIVGGKQEAEVASLVYHCPVVARSASSIVDGPCSGSRRF